MPKSISDQVRIIAGQWRGRIIRFPATAGLRPTHNRIRETLFNWLAPHIEGARCLDLFAGSGALGLEALSRGARHVTFVDRAAAVIRTLRDHCVALGVTQASEVIQATCPNGLHDCRHAPFDVVFLDPPFAHGLVVVMSEWLEARHYLVNGSLIYVEAEKALASLALPSNWTMLKRKQTARLTYALWQRNAR